MYVFGTHHLVGQHNDGLDRKLPVTKVEEVLQAGPQQVNDHHIVLPLYAIPLQAWYASCTEGREGRRNELYRQTAHITGHLDSMSDQPANPANAHRLLERSCRAWTHTVAADGAPWWTPGKREQRLATVSRCWGTLTYQNASPVTTYQFNARLFRSLDVRALQKWKGRTHCGVSQQPSE